MGFFNHYGLLIMIVIMIPNIIYAIKTQKNSNKINSILENIEQISRYGCFVLMIFNLPYTYLNFNFKNGHTIYIIVNSILLVIYILFWILFIHKRNIFTIISLATIPVLIFFISGVLLRYIPLMLISLIFGYCHIKISLKSFYEKYI